MNHWLWFAAGVIASFAISFLAMIGWWFLIISRDKKRTPQQVSEDFDRIKRSIKGYEYESRN